MRAPLAYVGDAVAQAAEQRAHGLAHRLALEVPARDVDGRKRQREDAARARSCRPRAAAWRRSASTWVGILADGEPGERRPPPVLSAGVSAPPKNVRPSPIRPWSVPSSRVTNSRVSVGAGRPTTSGLSAGVRSTRVVTW